MRSGRTSYLGGRAMAMALVAVAAITASCASESDDISVEDAELVRQPARDWRAHPAIVEIDDAAHVYAVSDVHGAYAELGHLLEANGLIGRFSTDPERADDVTWTGGPAVLVVVGDVINKGAESIGAIDFLRALTREADAAGGRVVVTIGNHEAEFLADPGNDKANASTEDGVGLALALRARDVKPKDVARARDAAGRGAWLASLPFAVRVGDWFFSHGGNTDGRDLSSLAKALSKAVDKHGYGDDEILGKRSILEDKDWYGDPEESSVAKEYAEALGVKHLAFGHDPGAFDDRGRILSAADGRLVKLNVNMGLTHEESALVSGALLHVDARAGDHAEVLRADGTATVLF